MAIVRSQYPWAAVACSNANFEVSFLSQFSSPLCSCAEVLTPSFSFYVTFCYFQHSDDIEEHLRHLEEVLHSQRRWRLLVSTDANAWSSFCGPQDSYEKGVQVEELFQKFGLHVGMTLCSRLPGCRGVRHSSMSPWRHPKFSA